MGFSETQTTLSSGTPSNWRDLNNNGDNPCNNNVNDNDNNQLYLLRVAHNSNH